MVISKTVYWVDQVLCTWFTMVVQQVPNSGQQADVDWLELPPRRIRTKHEMTKKLRDLAPDLDKNVARLLKLLKRGQLWKPDVVNGRFKVKRLLGGGTYGRVFQGKQYLKHDVCDWCQYICTPVHRALNVLEENLHILGTSVFFSHNSKSLHGVRQIVHNSKYLDFTLCEATSRMLRKWSKQVVRPTLFLTNVSTSHKCE